MMNIGVVGYGYWGPNVARNFHSCPGAKLTMVSDISDKRLGQAQSMFPFIKVTKDALELVRSKDVDVVAVVTPVIMHYEVAREALLAGKHIFVEKPFTTTSDQARQLIELADKKGLKIMVDHTFLFTGAVRKMKEIINSGALGRLLFYDSVRVNLGLFQHDVNVIWDLAPHDLSIMDYVLPKEPIQVAAHGARHVAGSKIENIAYITLRFADETLAHFHVNWLAPAKVRRIIIGGSKKMLVFDDLSPDEKIKIYDKGLKFRETDDSELRQALAGYRIGDMYVPNIETTEALRRETDHFLECVRTGARPESDGDAGRRVVRILVAAQESLARNGAFIDL